MPFLPRKGILAIAAVVDIALNDRERPVSAKTLAVRHGLPPRHLEPVLQALVRDGILKGIRGPGGGYELAAEPREITAEQILRAAELIDEGASGFVVGALAIDELSDALAKLDVAMAHEMGRRARQRAETLSLESMAERLLALYRSLISV